MNFLIHIFQIGSQGDPPSLALEFEHKVENNDIIVVGTDGLFDNIDEKQIIATINPLLSGKETVLNTTLAADAIAQLAYKYSLDK